jgi:hypothetical protein
MPSKLGHLAAAVTDALLSYMPQSRKVPSSDYLPNNTLKPSDFDSDYQSSTKTKLPRKCEPAMGPNSKKKTKNITDSAADAQQNKEWRDTTMSRNS